MIISTEKTFIFVHIPKTAGKSVTAALDRHASRGLAHRRTIHETMAEFHRRQQDETVRPGLFRRRKRIERMPQGWDDYFSFAFVRNPWDRVVSMYSFYRRMGYPWIAHVDTFEQFVGDLESGAQYLLDIHGPRPQVDFVTDFRGRQIVSFIGRFENIAEDFAKICDTIGVGCDLPRRNVSERSDYTEYFTGELRDTVGEIYADDIAMFGYSYGE